MKYAMRPALPGDRNEIMELKFFSIRPYVEEIWGWDEDFQKADFDSDFLKYGKFEVIEVENKFAGFIQQVENGGKIEICEIHLRSEFRGNGIGSDLLRKIMQDAQGKVISLGCFKKNEKAKKLYL